MKKGYSWLLYIICFILGALVSYLLTQWKFLEIDPKINVSTTLIALMTAVIGLFIATTLKRNQNKSSNLHNYLFPKLNATWEKFIAFSHTLDLNDKIKVSDLAKHIKELNQGTMSLKQMFSSFGLNNSSIDSLEKDFEKLESLMSTCTITKNVIKYSLKKTELGKVVESTNSHFVTALKEINKLS